MRLDVICDLWCQFSFSSTVKAGMKQISFNYYPIHVTQPAAHNQNILKVKCFSFLNDSVG